MTLSRPVRDERAAFVTFMRRRAAQWQNMAEQREVEGHAAAASELRQSALVCETIATDIVAGLHRS